MNENAVSAPGVDSATGASLRVGSVLGAGTCLVLALAIVASTLVSIFESHLLGPFRDFWKFMPVLEAIDRGESLLPLLFKHHGHGHRLVVPRLFYLAEYSFFQGRNVFLLSASMMLHVAFLSILLRAVLKRENALSLCERIFALGFVLAVGLSATQYGNFIRPWNIHWSLCGIGVISALACGIRIHASSANDSPRKAWFWWTLAVTAAWIANYSMANGLLAWPCLLLAGGLLRLKWPFMAGIAAMSGLAIPLFLVDLSGVSAATKVDRIGDIFVWMLKCLGSPVSWTNESTGMALACFGTIAAGGLAIRLFRRGTSVLPGEALLLGTMVFAWGSVVAIAVGRVNFAWDPSRYQTVVLLFWQSLALLGVLAFRGAERSHRRVRSGVILASTLWLALCVLPAHTKSREEMKEFVSGIRAANTAILIGVPIRHQYVKVLPLSDRRHGRDTVARYRPLLEEKKLGVFAAGHHELLGRRSDDIFPSGDDRTCEGGVERAFTALPGGLGYAELRGWVSGEVARNLEDVLFVVNHTGVIVGLARVLYRPYDLLGARSDARVSWRGYARTGPGSLNVLGIGEDGAVCTVVRGEPIAAGRRPPGRWQR